MGILEGQVAVVTGAGRGFGRAIAERLAAEGASIALLSRSLSQLEEVAEAIRAAGGPNGPRAIAVRCDVTDPKSIEHAIDKVEELLDDLARCAQRVLDLASGRYDALSGNYYELPDDLDAELAKAC